MPRHEDAAELERKQGITHTPPKARIKLIQRVDSRLRPHGLQGLADEREVEFAAEGEVPERVEGAEDIDGVEGGEECYCPVCWGASCIILLESGT